MDLEVGLLGILKEVQHPDGLVVTELDLFCPVALVDASTLDDMRGLNQRFYLLLVTCSGRAAASEGTSSRNSLTNDASSPRRMTAAQRTRNS